MQLDHGLIAARPFSDGGCQVLNRCIEKGDVIDDPAGHDTVMDTEVAVEGELELVLHNDTDPVNRPGRDRSVAMGEADRACAMDRRLARPAASEVGMSIE